jgi:hypothetical protein
MFELHRRKEKRNAKVKSLREAEVCGPSLEKSLANLSAPSNPCFTIRTRFCYLRLYCREVLQRNHQSAEGNFFIIVSFFLLLARVRKLKFIFNFKEEDSNIESA